MPLVSVVIPVYNGEKFIKNAVETVLNQTFKDTQIVVVDDASTDRTKQIIRKTYQDLLSSGKIKLIENKINKERVYSRNIGVENSSGEYVYFLDYDDEWSKTHIEQTLSYFKEFDVLYSFPRTIIDENSNPIRVSKKKLKPLEEIIFSGNIGYPSATAFKKEKFPYYKQEFLMREDWEIFIRSYITGLKIKVLDINSVFIREHTNRTSKNKEFLQATLKVYQEYKDKIPQQVLPHFLIHISDVAFKFGDFKTGYKMLFSAVKQNPKVLFDKRNLLNFIKRSVRIDRMLLNR